MPNVPAVLGMPLSEGVAQLQNLGFVVVHDGGDDFGEKTDDGLSYVCSDSSGKVTHVSTKIRWWREIASTDPSSGEQISVGASIAVKSVVAGGEQKVPAGDCEPV